MRYLIILEPTATGARRIRLTCPVVLLPDRPNQTSRKMREAIQLHLDGLREEGVGVPRGQSSATYVEVAA